MTVEPIKKTTAFPIDDYHDDDVGKSSRLQNSQKELGYTKQSLKHYRQSQYIRKYLARKGTASASSASSYSTHLTAFAFFIFKRYDQQDVDEFLDSIKSGQYDPYDILAEFASFLRATRTGKIALGANHISTMVKTAKKMFRLSGIIVNNEDFREFVSLPRRVRRSKSPIEKSKIVTLLNSCKDIQLATAIMFHAVFGPRPVEACAVRNMDLDMDSEVPSVIFRAEYTKTRVERRRYLTKELKKQIQIWNKYKYRKHRAMYKNGEIITVTPESKPTDLLLAPWHNEGEQPQPENLYSTLREKFAELVDTLEIGWESDNRRRKITFYSFRRFVKSVISDLGFADFSEYWIGHQGSVYYNKPEKERIALFHKIEPHLTYQNSEFVETQTTIAMQAQLEVKDVQMQQMQQQMALIMMYLTEQDPSKKIEISRQLIEKGYHSLHKS